jgi:ATP-dependent DNA helicase RecQ
LLWGGIDVHSEARAVLQKVFGYPDFKGGQGQVVESLLGRHDTLAIMPTGAGKSLCYQLPSLIFGGVTLVVSPLIALMKDQVDALGSLGVPATFINSSLKKKEIRARMEDAARGRYNLIYVAPERLEADGFMELAEAMQVSFVAVDEAHCVSQWGHDFRPSYRKIAPFINSLPKRPLLGAFTATATPEIKEDIIKLLGLREPEVFVTGFDRENLYLSVLRGENKSGFILDYLAAHPGQPGIIYAATRKDVDKIYEELQKQGLPCSRYHAGMKEAERGENQDAFLRDDLPVMVATNAFGMGIDKSNVRFVIHHNMPKNMEAYYQEAGRAGRDGERGECILLFGPQDVLMQKFMIDQSVYSPLRKKNEFMKLQLMSDYCHTSRCLRNFILEYFGETGQEHHCGNCLNCLDDRETLDVTREAQMVLSCVFRMKERFGSTMVAEVLKGSANKRIRQLGLDRLSTHGLLKTMSTQEIRDFIGFLAAEGYLRLTEGEYPLVKLGRKAAEVLKHGEPVLRKTAPMQTAEPDDNLFEALRRLRKAIADRENIAPYIVFSDKTLREMSEKKPPDLAAMQKIHGVGEMKLQKYGEEFLRLIESGC